MAAFDDPTLVKTVFDLLIPAQPPFPGAGSLALLPVVQRILERAPEALPVLEAGFDALRQAANPPTPETLQQLGTTQPAFLPVLQYVLYMAYYQQPEVHRAYGLSGHPPFPKGHTIDATDADLLKKIKKRS